MFDNTYEASSIRPVCVHLYQYVYIRLVPWTLATCGAVLPDHILNHPVITRLALYYCCQQECSILCPSISEDKFLNVSWQCSEWLLLIKQILLMDCQTKNQK